MRIVLVGPPGTGEGTQAAHFVNNLAISEVHPALEKVRIRIRLPVGRPRTRPAAVAGALHIPPTARGT
ncbi:hypothetical protein GCM10010341_60420 [Streptomyces noursei]|nr:hypothetical protein GCM10010341_60420 [Streptomyces noursei]